MRVSGAKTIRRFSIGRLGIVRQQGDDIQAKLDAGNTATTCKPHFSISRNSLLSVDSDIAANKFFAIAGRRMPMEFAKPPEESPEPVVEESLVAKIYIIFRYPVISYRILRNLHAVLQTK